LKEPNLGKTNPRVTLFIRLRFVLRPLSDSFIFLTLTRLVVVIKFVNFRFALFTPPSRRLSLALALAVAGCTTTTKNIFIANLELAAYEKKMHKVITFNQFLH
jgi:hypothetical protein